MKSRSESIASYYDRRTGDHTQPVAEANGLLTVTIDVAGGPGDKAFFSLRGSIHGEGSGGGDSGCAQVEVQAPNGTSIKGGAGCVGRFTIPIDESGPLDPGSHSLVIDSVAEAEPGFAFARAKTTWDLSFVVAGCSIVGTPGDDPNLDGTSDDDVICGLAGADTIDGGDGDDTIFGGAGDDNIDGGRGADVIFGLDGQDVIRGGGGRDSLYGGADGDILMDERGPNLIDGGGASTPSADRHSATRSAAVQATTSSEDSAGRMTSMATKGTTGSSAKLVRGRFAPPADPALPNVTSSMAAPGLTLSMAVPTATPFAAAAAGTSSSETLPTTRSTPATAAATRRCRADPVATTSGGSTTLTPHVGSNCAGPVESRAADGGSCKRQDAPRRITHDCSDLSLGHTPFPQERHHAQENVRIAKSAVLDVVRLE